IGRGLASIRGIKNVSETIWLYYQYKFFQKYLFNIASGGGSTFPNINQDLIKNMILPYPCIEEQQQIATILSNIDSQIDSQTQYEEKLEKLKKSLMQKLLTGEVRV
ncbi:MAG: restriction endonuclease subunit S, partial [Nitrosopumilus sp.]|nr:restriction endonuclease subunit S [Nitrosopumilus sp.]